MRKLWWRLVRFGFRLLYNELAWTYDTVSYVVSLGAWRCWIRTALRHLPEPETGRILEMAHGTGNLQLDLYAAGYDVAAVDLSTRMGQITRRKLMRHNNPVWLSQGRVQALPFPVNTFAGVVSTFPTAFIQEVATQQEVYRVLSPGGRWVIVLSGLFEGQGMPQRVLEFAYRVTGQRSDDADSALDSVLHAFRQAGFTAHIEWETCPRSRVLLLIAEK